MYASSVVSVESFENPNFKIHQNKQTKLLVEKGKHS